MTIFTRATILSPKVRLRDRQWASRRRRRKACGHQAPHRFAVAGSLRERVALPPAAGSTRRIGQ